MRRFTQPGKRVASFTRTFARLRWALNFDGVGARGVLAKRAIDPDVDIDIEWVSGPSINLSTSRTIISQTLTATAGSQEFFAFISTNGNLVVRVGGVERPTFPQIAYQPNTKYRWRLQGTTVNLWVNDVLQSVMSMTRGVAREPSAVTTIGATVNSFFYLGVLRDIKINGTLWPIADVNQTIQLPEPSGLGAELITSTILENPAAKGSQWTYLGSGRWQLIGDGSYSNLTFILLNDMPSQGYFEFEIESITGELRCSVDTVNVVGNRSNVTAGIKRIYYLTKPSDFTFVRNGTSVVSCVIKNISFKPLGTCNPITLANVTSTNWEDLEI